VLAAQPALAQRAEPARAEASPRDELVRGAQLLEGMNATAAIAPLERAARGGAGPLAWFNLGLAYRAVGRLRDAIDAWDRYLSEPEPGAPAERVSAVRTERAALATRCALLVLRWSPASATVTVDDRAVVAASGATTTGSTRLDPGEHRVEGRAPGFDPWSRAITLRPGETQEIDVVLPRARTLFVPTRAAPSIAPVAASNRAEGLPWWGWTGGAVAIAGIATAIALAVDGQAIFDQCRAAPGPCAANEANVQAGLDARTAGVVVGASVGAAGLSVLVGGVVVAVVRGPARGATASPTRAP
jgi:hypothetical protein